MGHQGDGPVSRLAGRLGDRRRRRARDAEPRGRCRQLHVPAVRQQPPVDDGRGDRRDRLDHHHDRDLLHRDRAVRTHAAVPPRDRVRHADRVRNRRAGEGLRQPPRALDHARVLLVQPVRDPQLRCARRRRAARRIHLLGLGFGRQRERGDRGSQHGAGPLGGHLHVHPDRDLRARGDRRPGLRRPQQSGHQPDGRIRAPRQGRARLGTRQDPDHRRAHVSLGFDTDDDPADGADDAVDGPFRARSRGGSARSSRGSSPPASRRSRWGRCRWSSMCCCR